MNNTKLQSIASISHTKIGKRAFVLLAGLLLVLVLHGPMIHASLRRVLCERVDRRSRARKLSIFQFNFTFDLIHAFSRLFEPHERD
jgi:hypothetical protein